MVKTITHYIKHFCNGPVSFAQGMWVTLKNLGRRKATQCYPEEMPDLRPRFRGLHGLTKDPETGELNCIGCLACARICPDDLIGMTLEKREGHQGRYPVEFSLNIGPCCFCGWCVEACPTPMKAIIMSSEFEVAPYDRDGTHLVLTKEKLLAIGEREMERRQTHKGEPEEQDNIYFTWAEESAKAERMAKGAARKTEEKPAQAKDAAADEGAPDEEKAERIARARARAAARKAAGAAEEPAREDAETADPEAEKAERIARARARAAARKTEREAAAATEGEAGDEA